MRTTATPAMTKQFDPSPVATRQRRRTVAVLLERLEPVTERDLATRLVARRTGRSTDAATAQQRRRTRLDLRHGAVPALVDAGVVDRSPAGLVLRNTEWIQFQETPLSVPRLSDPDHPAWEPLEPVLFRPLRERLLCVLGDTGPMSLPVLAGALMEDDGCSFRDGSFGAVRSRLYHVDLPTLADRGLLEYDHESSRVTPSDALWTVLPGARE